MGHRTRIVGIDPGLRNAGWGVIDVEGQRFSFVACGTVRSDAAATMSMRLSQIYEGLCAVFEAHHPEEASIENTFVNSDPQSALKLGQARGVALLVPALFDVPVSEYQPSAIKSALTGTGAAQKPQVAAMVRVILPGAAIAGPDSADALAAAITHANLRTRRDLEARIASGG